MTDYDVTIRLRITIPPADEPRYPGARGVQTYVLEALRGDVARLPDEVEITVDGWTERATV